MGAALRPAYRFIQNYNVENRAQRVLERGSKKAAPAPHHKSTEEAFAQAQRDPEIRRQLSEKNPELAENLRSVRVNSTDPPPPPASERPLPSRDYQPADWQLNPEWGVVEPRPEKIPHGRLAFSEAKLIMSERLKEFGESDTLAIPSACKDSAPVKRVPEEQLLRMLRYFSPFEKIGTMAIASKDYLIEQETDYHFLGVGVTEFTEALPAQHERLRVRREAEREHDENVQIQHRKKLIDEEFEGLRIAAGRSKDDPRLLHPKTADMPPPLPSDDPRLTSSPHYRTPPPLPRSKDGEKAQKQLPNAEDEKSRSKE